MAEQHENFVGIDVVAGNPLLGNLPKSWWYASAEAERVPSYKIGKYRRFRMSELVRHFEAQRRGPRPAAP